MCVCVCVYIYIYVYVRVLVSDFWLPTLCVFAESLLCFVWRCCLHVPLCLHNPTSRSIRPVHDSRISCARLFSARWRCSRSRRMRFRSAALPQCGWLAGISSFPCLQCLIWGRNVHVRHSSHAHLPGFICLENLRKPSRKLRHDRPETFIESF